MGNEIAVIDFSNREMIDTLKATVAQGLSDQEFKLFAEFCKSTRLNPFKREIWAIKAGNRLQLMTGINGFFAIANSHPQFDGLECEIELDDKGLPAKAIARAHRKDRKFPAVGIALLRESRGSSPVWNQQPSVMLTKVAKARALREAFPQEMGGLYTDDEMPAQYTQPTRLEEVVKPASEIVDTGPHWYRLKDVAPAARKKAIEYAEQSSAELLDSKELIFRSDKALPKLRNYEIEEPQIAEPVVDTPLGEQIDGGAEIEGEEAA